MFPNLLEFLCEFLLFQDFISKNKDDMFINIFQGLPLSSNLSVLLQNGEIVIFSQGKLEQRSIRMKSSFVIPKAIL